MLNVYIYECRVGSEYSICKSVVIPNLLISYEFSVYIIHPVLSVGSSNRGFRLKKRFIDFTLKKPLKKYICLTIESVKTIT